MALARTDVWGPEGWRVHGACRDTDTNLFFPAGDTGPAATQIAKAKVICGTCPVRDECLSFALTFYQEYGIWGGTTEDERRVIRRRRRAQQRRPVAAI